MLGDGQWIAAAVVSVDTNGNGQLDLPSQRTTLAGGACRGAPLSYSTYGFQGDEFERRFIRAADGYLETRDVLAWGADAIVVRDSVGALRWVTAGGAEQELVPATCNGQLLAIWPEGPALLVGCGAPGATGPLRVYDEAGAHDLGETVTLGQHSDWSCGRIVPISGARLVDLAQGRVFPRAHSGEQGMVGASVLETIRGGTVRVRNLETGQVTELTAGTDEYVRGQRWGSLAAVVHDDVIVVDIEAAAVLGTLPALPIAMREDALALVPTEGDRRVPQGPLTWIRPIPVAR